MMLFSSSESSISARALGNYLRITLFAVLALSSGCAKPPPRSIVEGKVTANGVPLFDVEVVFYPDPEKGNKGPRATSLTDKQGIYHLKDDKGEEGIVVGVSRVCISDPKSRPHMRAIPRGGDDPQPIPKSRVSAEFGSPMTTPFKEIEVKEGSRQTLDFDVAGKGKSTTRM